MSRAARRGYGGTAPAWWLGDGHTPTADAARLALYQAIWHPGEQNWPVKGIPERLVVPTSLGANNTDLARASAYLLCDLDTHREQPWVGRRSTEALRRTVQQAGVAAINQQCLPHERTIVRIQQELMQWIAQQFYPYHRAAPVWHSIRQHGVVMPGHDTPAAGWLLPVTDVIDARGARITIDGPIAVRRFPHYYLERDDTLFVQDTYQGVPRLHCLKR